MDIKKSKLNFQYYYLNKTLFMHFPFFIIFCKYCISYILCGHCKIITILVIGFEIFWQFYNIFKEYFYNIFSKYFGAVWVTLITSEKTSSNVTSSQILII